MRLIGKVTDCACVNCERKVPVAALVSGLQLCRDCLRHALDVTAPLVFGPPVLLVAKATPPIESPDDSVKYAEEKCREFLAANSVEPPRFLFKDGPSGGLHGCYQKVPVPTVTVFVDTCRQGGMARARPGFWEDLTITGVCAHECGHHVDVCRKELYRGYYDCYMKEAPVGINAKLSRREDLADALMLFVRNPSLLLELCPLRHAHLTECGLVPTEKRHWREVLARFPDSLSAVEERLKP